MIQFASDFSNPVVDRDFFFSTFKGDSLSSKVELDRLFDFMDASPVVDRTDSIAYILATIRHECGNSMLPVKEMIDDPKTPRDETPWVDDSKLRYLKGIDINYQFHPNTGHIYYGRGYVQLTWYSLYKKFGQMLGLDLVGNPDLLLQPEHAWRVLELGMFKGLFTGYNMSMFFSGTISDSYNARRIINPQDYRTYQLVKNYAKEFEESIRYSA